MYYKYELHCHTGEVSRCGRVPGREIVKMYRDAGYSGLVITDHYSPMTFPLSKVACPQRAIDYYTKGYHEALKCADDDFSVMLGMELRYYATANDFLVYGVTEDFLRKSGNLMSLYPKRFFKLAHNNGMIVLQAHPFRDWMVRISPKYLDGTEIHNGKTNEEQNAKAEKWASDNDMKILVSGSDFHRPQHLATGGIITDCKITNNDELLRILRSGEYEMITEPLIPAGE